MVNRMADPPGFAVSAHGGRASVNIPQCRGVDFIGVVTTVGATPRNLRTPITCQIYIVISLRRYTRSEISNASKPRWIFLKRVSLSER